MRVTRIPEDILWELKNTFPILQGECYANSGVSTLLCLGNSDYSLRVKNNTLLIRYALGFLTPPGHETVPHAWLVITEADQVTYYWDATLQVNSPLWNIQNQNFKYILKKIITAGELQIWLREKYPERNFTTDGIPYGCCRFPIISQAGCII